MSLPHAPDREPRRWTIDVFKDTGEISHRGYGEPTEVVEAAPMDARIAELERYLALAESRATTLAELEELYRTEARRMRAALERVRES